MAVQVEDHPLDYGDFEGTIPRGEYGGGTVLLWDRGTWRPDGDPRGLQSGKLKFHLEGEKLRGGWTLVRMGGGAGEGGKNWLLIKERDATARPGDGEALLRDRPESVASGGDLAGIADRSTRVWTATGEVEKERTAAGELPGARRAPMPSRPQPELATLVADAPLGDAWLRSSNFRDAFVASSAPAPRSRRLRRTPRPAARNGYGRASSPRSASRSGRRMAACGTRRFRACGRTRAPRRSSGRPRRVATTTGRPRQDPATREAG